MGDQPWRRSRKLVLFVVLVALFLDAILMTVILPIVPDYLAKLQMETSDKSSEWTAEADLSLEIGFLFASKAFVQVLVGPCVGFITTKIGYTKPMMVGFFVMFASTLTYAFANTFYTMLIARAMQGVGSSFSSISGLAMLAQWYPDDEERGQAMSVAFAGTGLGVIVGPVFGGFFYQYFGKTLPFLILAIFALLDGALRFLILEPKNRNDAGIEAPSLIALIKDPYIILAAGSIFLANTGVAILEPLLPIQMMNTMNANSFEQGISFLPLSGAFMIGLNVFGRFAYRIGRHLAAMIGLIAMGCFLIVIPLARNMFQLILPNIGYGLAISMVESAMLPFMAYLVDTRHTSVYGNVYTIADTAFCLAFFVGPSLGGFLMTSVGFQWTLWISAFLCFLYAPIMIFLRDPPLIEEEESLLSGSDTDTVASSR